MALVAAVIEIIIATCSDQVGLGANLALMLLFGLVSLIWPGAFGNFDKRPIIHPQPATAPGTVPGTLVATQLPNTSMSAGSNLQDLTANNTHMVDPAQYNQPGAFKMPSTVLEGNMSHEPLVQTEYMPDYTGNLESTNAVVNVDHPMPMPDLGYGQHPPLGHLVSSSDDIGPGGFVWAPIENPSVGGPVHQTP